MKARLSLWALLTPNLVDSLISRTATRDTFSLQCNRHVLSASSKKDEDDAGDEDWRDFRAKLVMGEKVESSAATATSDPSEPWAYDAGDVIEKGSIILSSLEQAFGHGLNQQYFHKSVILVLEHEDNVFTKGIILNRPTDLYLSDADFEFKDRSRPPRKEKKEKWRVWFGGDVQWISSDRPELVCLHSLQSDAAREASQSVLKDHVVQYTTMEKAYDLIEAGEAEVGDFYLCGGYCGWGPGQLQGELERKSWHMVATDAQTVWEELKARQEESGDITGESTWKRLMERIGRGDETKASDYDKEFDNQMLRVWAEANLVFQKDDKKDDIVSQLLKTPPDIGPGTLLRASSNSESPFLLNEQGFHQSIILISQDEEDFTVGLLLNRPWARTVELDFPGDDRSVSIAARFGGRYELKGMPKKSSFWFHCNDQLKSAKIGSPLKDADGIWKCGEKQVRAAIRDGIAGEKDFMCVKGLNIWPKIKGYGSSLMTNIQVGHYDIVPSSRTRDVWKALVSQDKLSKMTIDRNIMLGKAAWLAAGGKENTNAGSEEADQQKLAEEALKRWMALFLLDDPFLQGSSEEEPAFE
mmetsp:Transcript_2798/g.3981  ORF Transcript_2798/g.3981 Transcript_2798/m.3981 type:complete len:583 (+) Transcript_2798:62-1810(+)